MRLSTVVWILEVASFLCHVCTIPCSAVQDTLTERVEVRVRGNKEKLFIIVRIEGLRIAALQVLGGRHYGGTFVAESTVHCGMVRHVLEVNIYLFIFVVVVTCSWLLLCFL